MRVRAHSVAAFNVRSATGAVLPAAPRFSTGLLTEQGGTCAAVNDDQVIAASLRVLSERVVRSNALVNPRATREYLAVRLAGLEHEVFACVYLDNRNRVLACEELFRGTIDGASVHPREVVKRALIHNAAAVILAHNHPSGVAEPSQCDELITQRLKAALALVEIRVLDHVIVAGALVESMAERGVI